MYRILYLPDVGNIKNKTFNLPPLRLKPPVQPKRYHHFALPTSHFGLPYFCCNNLLANFLASCFGLFHQCADNTDT